MTEFIVKSSEAFQIRVRKNRCLRPNDLNSLEFIQESIKDGEVENTSTYQFFLTDSQIKELSEGLVK